MSKSAMRVLVSGRVQGVGFRAATRRSALELGLSGSAVNLPNGRVEVHAEGDRRACEQLVAWLGGTGAPGTVDDVIAEWVAPNGATELAVR